MCPTLPFFVTGELSEKRQRGARRFIQRWTLSAIYCKITAEKKREIKDKNKGSVCFIDLHYIIQNIKWKIYVTKTQNHNIKNNAEVILKHCVVILQAITKQAHKRKKKKHKSKLLFLNGSDGKILNRLKETLIHLSPPETQSLGEHWKLSAIKNTYMDGLSGSEIFGNQCSGLFWGLYLLATLRSLIIFK